MAIDFPSSPTINQIYTFGGRSWQWNGVAWDLYNAVIDAVGMNEVKSAYVFTKSIPNGEFVGSTDV